MDAGALPLDKVHRVDDIIEHCGSIGVSPWRVDLANVLVYLDT
jgi:hypothetical protein